LLYFGMDEVIKIWQEYINANDWQQLIKNTEPKQTGCGPVYELPNPIERPQESFALADMRNVRVAEPHYHIATEIYFVLQGKGLMVTGGKGQEIHKGSVVVIPSNTAHFTIPKENLVLAAVNILPFKYIDLRESNKEVKFDKNQFEKIVQEEAL
jgi:mannose-6-phosphate isomerase-like protein (cupin superfamily)